MTPIPLLLGLCVKKLTERFCPTQSESSSGADPEVCGIIKGTIMNEKHNNNPLQEVEYRETFKESESTQKLMLTRESPNDEQTPPSRM